MPVIPSTDFQAKFDTKFRLLGAAVGSVAKLPRTANTFTLKGNCKLSLLKIPTVAFKDPEVTAWLTSMLSVVDSPAFTVMGKDAVVLKSPALVPDFWIPVTFKSPRVLLFLMVKSNALALPTLISLPLKRVFPAYSTLISGLAPPLPGRTSMSSMAKLYPDIFDVKIKRAKRAVLPTWANNCLVPMGISVSTNFFTDVHVLPSALASTSNVPFQAVTPEAPVPDP